MSFPSLGDLSDPGIEPVSPALANELFTTKSPGKPSHSVTPSQTYVVQPNQRSGACIADQHPLQELQFWGVKKQWVSLNCFTPFIFSQLLIKCDHSGSIKCYSKIPSHIHLSFTSTKRQDLSSSKPFPWQVFQHQPWH